MIDILTCATVRPELLDRTLTSFKTLMLGDYYPRQMIANIDDIGVGNLSDECNLFDAYFMCPIIHVSSKPDYAEAIHWLIKHSTAEYVLLLEDDWVLEKECPIASLVNILANNPNLMSLKLYTNSGYRWELSQLVKHDGYYTSADKSLNTYLLTLNPTLWRGDYLRSINEQINGKYNFEKYCMKHPELHGDYDFGLITNDNLDIHARDIGIEWRKLNGFSKVNRDEYQGFRTWSHTSA